MREYRADLRGVVIDNRIWPEAGQGGQGARCQVRTDTVEKVRTLKESKYFKLVHAFSESERGGSSLHARTRADVDLNGFSATSKLIEDFAVVPIVLRGASSLDFFNGITQELT